MACIMMVYVANVVLSRYKNWEMLQFSFQMPACVILLLELRTYQLSATTYDAVMRPSLANLSILADELRRDPIYICLTLTWGSTDTGISIGIGSNTSK